MNLKQEQALKDYLQEVITPLIEQVLIKKLGQAISFAATEIPQRKTWIGLTSNERSYFNSFLEGTGVVEAVEAHLKDKNT